MGSKSLVAGVGINDADYKIQIYKRSDNNKRHVIWRCPYYSKWASMLQRSCCNKTKLKHPSYMNTEVCEEWKIFSNFKQWMESQDWEGKDLDKDLLSHKMGVNPIYSPDTCIFLPYPLNLLLAESTRRMKEDGLPTGVTVHKQSGRYRVRSKDVFTGKYEHLGMFDTIEDAKEVYMLFKIKNTIKIIKMCANKDLEVEMINFLTTNPKSIFLGIDFDKYYLGGLYDPK